MHEQARSTQAHLDQMSPEPGIERAYRSRRIVIATIVALKRSAASPFTQLSPIHHLVRAAERGRTSLVVRQAVSHGRDGELALHVKRRPERPGG